MINISLRRTLSLYKKRNRRTFVKRLGIALIFFAVVFTCLLVFAQIEEVELWYNTWQTKLAELEARVAMIQEWWLLIIVIFLLFTLKSIFPLITIPAICLTTGIVLPGYVAVGVNLAGVAWLMTIRFFWGKRLGGGSARRIIKKNIEIREFLERDGSGNPYMLFLFRLIPSFPVNSVSQLYGAMDIGYVEYLLISLGGFSYKLVLYTIIGSNVYNPLSASFLVPIIIFFLVSGLMLVGLNYIVDLIIRFKEKRNTSSKPGSKKSKISKEKGRKMHGQF
jgi:uncharacterized membrane protein YdjX (TVP38/TMEM64 family)